MLDICKNNIIKKPKIQPEIRSNKSSKLHKNLTIQEDLKNEQQSSNFSKLSKSNTYLNDRAKTASRNLDGVFKGSTIQRESTTAHDVKRVSKSRLSGECLKYVKFKVRTATIDLTKKSE